MRVFEKCPVCGEFAFVQPEYSNAYKRVFRCDSGHLFRKNIRAEIKPEEKELWEAMPEWAKILRNCYPVTQSQ